MLLPVVTDVFVVVASVPRIPPKVMAMDLDRRARNDGAACGAGGIPSGSVLLLALSVVEVLPLISPGAFSKARTIDLDRRLKKDETASGDNDGNDTADLS